MSSISPPVIVIDSFEDVNENANHGSAKLKELQQNSNENTGTLNNSNELQEDSEASESCDNSKSNSSSRNNSLSKPNLTLQVPAPLQVPVKSSINLADSVTSETEVSSNVSSADGSSSPHQRTGNVTINFNRKENGILNSLSRHGSRETLREEELKHLKVEVRITACDIVPMTYICCLNILVFAIRSVDN